MAAHRVAIAKASFAAGLLRPDPTSVHRDEIAGFHAHLDRAVVRCSPSNVQKCKIWLATNVVPSQGRITALAKYLSALSASFIEDEGGSGAPTSADATTSVERKRLHILFVLNDLLHHTKHHGHDASKHTSFASNIQPFLIPLFGCAASFDQSKRPKHFKRILDLLALWEGQSYQGQQFIEKLRQTVHNAGNANADGQEISMDTLGVKTTDVGQIQTSKQAPFVMPASHGDASTPYYDLPAGNLMPHVVPNSSAPINPELVKPLQFMAGPADDSLATVVRDFLKDVGSTYHANIFMENERIVTDIDEMGQLMIEDEVSGDLVAGEGYYGWSIEFCEKMKLKRKGINLNTNGGDRGRSRSRSYSQSSGPRKRRRYSSSPDSNSSRMSRTSSGHRRSTSSPRSASRSRTRYQNREDLPFPQERSRSRSRRRSPHRSPSVHPSYAESIAKPPSQPTHPLSFPVPPRPVPNGAFITPADQITDPFLHTHLPPPAPSAPTNARHNYPLGPNGLPIPPPPPFHQGPWPPPPPNMPTGIQFPGRGPGSSVSPGARDGFIPPPPPSALGGSWQGGPPHIAQGRGAGRGETLGPGSWQYRPVPVPPPPPPPPHSPQQQQQQQHGPSMQQPQSWQWKAPQDRRGGHGAPSPPPRPPQLQPAWQQNAPEGYGRGGSQGQEGRGRGGRQGGRGR